MNPIRLLSFLNKLFGRSDRSHVDKKAATRNTLRWLKGLTPEALSADVGAEFGESRLDCGQEGSRLFSATACDQDALTKWDEEGLRELASFAV